MISTVIAGVVPQVTCGTSDEASIRTCWSNAAGSSVLSVRQLLMASLSTLPLGAKGRSPLAMYSNVVSSGAIIPARAPPSIDMLQTVIRPSIESAVMAGP